ncbi:MAG TPA: orotidine-5'-phosphate decarboxylase [Ignavibacteria bacterium]|nr:orotidine-5'-phosphate decarboxylase [Ignavibacteria bacterium]HMR41020.1 orotidine-5'-phosphate decarboxylase [Ignavibacteria bacterium]
MNYIEKLQNIITKNRSNLVVGLDPDIEKIPSFLLKYKNPVAEFNKLIIESSKDLVAGYKPNVAFYECLGEQGVEAIRETVKVIPGELIKICDAKRGDMGNTAEYYARTYFDIYDFDSITMSPYMGVDSVAPFLERKNKAVYLLALTSNSGSADFQKLKIEDKFLYEIVMEKGLEWNNDDNVGFVIGANHTDELNKFSAAHPEVSLLIPGIGAQANDLNKLLKNLHTNNFVINSSRGIIYSASGECSEDEFSESVREAVINLNSSVNEILKV